MTTGGAVSGAEALDARPGTGADTGAGGPPMMAPRPVPHR